LDGIIYLEPLKIMIGQIFI